MTWLWWSLPAHAEELLIKWRFRHIETEQTGSLGGSAPHRTPRTGLPGGSAPRGDSAPRTDVVGASFDHPTRVDVYIDGEKVAESDVLPESEPGRLRVLVPPGSHDVRVVAMANFEGQWEEHTIANAYALDATWNGQITGEKRQKLVLVFDIEKGTQVRQSPSDRDLAWPPRGS